MKLSEMFEKAGITDYADWSKEVGVTPNGNPGFEPRPYQLTGLNHLAAYLPRAANFGDPGTGKTLQLQAFLLWITGLGNKGVAVMPPALVPQFLQSFTRDFPGVHRYAAIGMVHGERDERQAQIDGYLRDGWPDILVMSYQTLVGKWRAARRQRITPKQEAALQALDWEESVKAREKLAEEMRLAAEEEDRKHHWKPGSAVTAYNFRAEVMKDLGYNLVVADEAHKLKNPSSEVHQAVRDFVNPWDGNASNGLVLATGSPIETNVEDAFGLINLLDPTVYGTMRQFERYHCVLLPGVPYRKVVDYANMDFLHQNLYARATRVTKRQAAPEMPPRVVTEIPVTLAKDHKALYDKLCRERVMVLEDGLVDATTQQSLYQLMQRTLLCPEAVCDKPPKSNALLEASDAVLDQIGDRKVILFAWYQESIEKLMGHYADRRPVMLNGSVSPRDRERAKKAFIEDPACRMLVANPVSGGVGLDGFQTVCSYAIVMEIFHGVGRFEQAVGRLERSGQSEAVNIYLLVPKGTIAVRLRNDLCRKEAFANEAVRDKKTLMSDLLGEEGIQGIIK